MMGRVLIGLAMCHSALAGPRADALATEAEEMYVADELIGARAKAEQALQLDGDQYRAHYVLGMVFHDSEGNLAQSMFHLGEARRAYETRYATSLDTEWRFHQTLVFNVQMVAQEIEEYDYQLDMIDYYNARYDPDLVAEKAWPLMKLGRLEEARAAAQEAIGSTDDWQRSVGLNAMCALEADRGDREAAYIACAAALEAERQSPNADVTVDAFNAALSAFQSLRYDEGEELAREANTGSTESTANPFALIAGAALAGGRGDDAVRAVRSMQGLRARVKPEYRDMNRAELDAVFSTLLLAAGEPELAYDIISRAIDFPDRRALTSGNAAQAHAGHALLRIAIRRARQERKRERRATEGVLSRVTGAVGGLVPDSVAWEDEAAVVAELSDEELLHMTLRMYLDGGIAGVPPWMLGDVIPVLGTGVVAEALEDVRQAEQLDRMGAFYDALDAEVQWWSGRYDATRELSASAVRSLPAEEVLLRARVTALAADAASRQGLTTQARALYSEAMQADPSVMRRLGLSLPATVTNSASGRAAGFVQSMLQRSVRFHNESSAFVVSISESSGVVKVCLTSPAGARLACALEPLPPASAEGEPPVEWSEWERAQATTDAFHRAAFALPTGLNRVELMGLDGTNTIDTDAAREEMSSLLEGLIRPDGE